MTENDLVNLIADRQLQKDYSDGEMAKLLGLGSRQAWQQIKAHKKRLSLPVFCYLSQLFPDLTPEFQLYVRSFPRDGNGRAKHKTNGVSQ